MKKSYEDIKENMTNKEIIKFIFVNSFFCIVCKVLLTIRDTITVSFLGHSQYKLSPYFIATLILNIGFYGIGYGFSSTSNMLASRSFGENKLNQVGQIINRGKLILFIYSIYSLIFIFCGKGLFFLIFSDVDIDLVHTFLKHMTVTIFFNFQVGMHVTYLNVHNNYLFPAIIDAFSTLTQFVIFVISFSIYSDEISQSQEKMMIVTAWSINISYILQYFYYTIYVYFFYSKSETYVKFNKETFKLGDYLYYSLHFVFFFMSHFLGGEQLNILINNYYGERTTFFDAFSISQKVYFLLQKISMGFSFFMINITGYLITKKFYSILQKITKIYFIFSFGVIITFIIFIESLADPISLIYTDKEDILKFVPKYFRIISFVIIPYHMENSLQSILTGHNKQKFAAYFSIIVTVIGGLGFGFLFIYGFEMGVEGVFLTMFILEILFAIVNFIFVWKIKIVPDDYQKKEAFIEEEIDVDIQEIITERGMNI